MTDAKNRQMALMLAPAQERLIGRDIVALCDNAAVSVESDGNELLLPSMDELIRVRLPDFVITQELDMWRHLTLLQYLDTADGTSLTGREIALSEMRGGLSRGLGFDKDISLMFSRDMRDVSAKDFARACEALGGSIVPGKADVNAVISYAPRFPVTVHFWCGDDEFPASGKALVDAAAEHYLTLEAAGGACSSVVQAIIRVLKRNAVNIRRAEASEMDEIMSLVCNTFEEQGIPRELDHIPAERAPIWWCAEENGTVIGTIASYIEDGKTHLGRFAIKPEYRGSGIGTRLLRFAIEDVFAHGAQKIYTESRPVTVKILEKMGAKISGETFPFYKGVCTPIDICKEDYETFKATLEMG